MRTYKEYLIPETIDHEELKYLISIGSCVLVKIQMMDYPDTIVELILSQGSFDNNEFYPLSDSDIKLLETTYIFPINYYIN
jgi:hypothetical protein